jgi:hypothetical protein
MDRRSTLDKSRSATTRASTRGTREIVIIIRNTLRRGAKPRHDEPDAPIVSQSTQRRLAVRPLSGEAASLLGMATDLALLLAVDTTRVGRSTPIDGRRRSDVPAL